MDRQKGGCLMLCRDSSCDSHRGRGHCSWCFTPWGCFRPFCGCHVDCGDTCRCCGAPLLIPKPRPVTYDVVFGTRWAA